MSFQFTDDERRLLSIIRADILARPEFYTEGATFLNSRNSDAELRERDASHDESAGDPTDYDGQRFEALMKGWREGVAISHKDNWRIVLAIQEVTANLDRSQRKAVLLLAVTVWDKDADTKHPHFAIFGGWDSRWAGLDALRADEHRGQRDRFFGHVKAAWDSLQPVPGSCAEDSGTDPVGQTPERLDPPPQVSAMATAAGTGVHKPRCNMRITDPSLKDPHSHLPADTQAVLWSACQLTLARSEEFADALAWLNGGYSETTILKQLLAELQDMKASAMRQLQDGENACDTVPRQKKIQRGCSRKELVRDVIHAAKQRGWRRDGNSFATRNQANKKNIITGKDVEAVWKWRDEYYAAQLQSLDERIREEEAQCHQWAKDRSWRLRKAVEKLINDGMPAVTKDALRIAYRVVLLATLIYYPDALPFKGEFGEWIWENEGSFFPQWTDGKPFVAGRASVLFNFTYSFEPENKGKPIPYGALSVDLERFTDLVSRAVKLLPAVALNGSEAMEVTTQTTGMDERYVFRRKGNVWEIRFEGESEHIRDMRGLRHIHRLLLSPGKPVPAVELMGWDPAKMVLSGDDGGEVMDAEGQAAARKKIDAIQKQIDDIQNPDRIAELEQEQERIKKEFVKATGKRKKKAVMQKTPHDKAADNIQKNITSAINVIHVSLPLLAQHFRQSIRTGKHCLYETSAISWAL